MPVKRFAAVLPSSLLFSLMLATSAAAVVDVAASAPGCEGGDALPIPWRAVAPSVWVWPPDEARDASDGNGGNGGRVMATSVIVDDGQALLIDPGPSHAQGLRLRQSLRCRFGARVVWVVNTHAHPENALANSAFADDQAAGGLHIGASRATAEAMRGRCPACLQSLTQRVGERTMAGTRIVLPDRVLSPGQTLRVGRRSVQVWDVVQAHSEGDLLLWDAQARVLWAGALVDSRRIPELAQGPVQGSLDGWLKALQRIESQAPRVLPHVLPRVLPRVLIGVDLSTDPPRTLDATRRYLSRLREGVLRALDAGRQPHDLEREPDLLPPPPGMDAARDGQRHAFNVMRAWLELEPLWMAGAADASAAPSASAAGASSVAPQQIRR